MEREGPEGIGKGGDRGLDPQKKTTFRGGLPAMGNVQK